MNRVLMSLVVVALFMTADVDGADVVWVHQMRGQEGDGTGVTPDAGEGTLAWEDDQWRALLEDAGHNIIAHDRFDELDLEPEGIETLNSADLVIFSRDTNSGDYNEFDEQEAWTEGVTVPMMILTPFVLRSSRWDMAESTGILETNKDDGIGDLIALEKDHPLFVGALNDQGEADIWDEDILGPDDSIDFLDIFDDDGKVGNGTVLAIEGDTEVPWIIHWEAGVEFYDGSLFTAGGPRLYYTVGSDDDPNSWGEKNTTAAGDRILLNAINWLTGGETLIGDFNGNGELDDGDLDLLADGQINNDKNYDLTGDGVTDFNDREAWVHDLKGTWIGDANLDGEFNSGDLVAVFAVGKYESGNEASWSEGDWDGDKMFDSSDFVVAFRDGGYEQGPVVQAVPEPSALILLLMAVLPMLKYRRSS